MLVTFFFREFVIFYQKWLSKLDLSMMGWISFWRSMLDPAPFLQIKRKHSDRPSFFYFSISCLSGVRYNSEEKVWCQVHYIANLRCTVHVGQSQATFVLSRSASLTSQKPDQYHFNWTNAFTWHFIKGFCPTFTPVLSWTPLPFTVLAKIVKPFFRISVFHRRKLQVWWKYMKPSKLPLLFLGDLSL